MLFNSLEFPVFLALVAGAHFLLLSRDAVAARKWVLLLASYGFYASWNPVFVLLLAFSTAVDFAVGRALAKASARGARRALLATSLAANLGLLGFFKYGRFFSESVMAAFGATLPEGAKAKAQVQLLTRVLAALMQLLLRSYQGGDFHQRAFFRLFSSWLFDLNAPDPSLDPIQPQVLSAFCSAFHTLQPSRLPGFASYCWCATSAIQYLGAGRISVLTGPLDRPARTSAPA